jgi:hypothetical protein
LVCSTRPLARLILDDAAFTEQVHAEWRARSAVESAITSAIACGLATDELEAAHLAEHCRSAVLHSMRLWAHDVIGDDELRNRSLFALDLTLLAASTDTSRPRLLDLARADSPRQELPPASDRQSTMV